MKGMAKSIFTKATLQWYKKYGRKLPWRQTTDAYKIMVSEFMLQQTQVSRVIPKYTAFLQKFPTIESLAHTSLDQVLTLWSGLGYNRRAKYLWLAAQKIVQNHKGIVPCDENVLLTFDGFGPYTANAIVAFAYNKPTIVIDANIKNIFHKVFGIVEKDISKELAKHVPPKHARDFYNALMDIGSLYYKKNSDYQTYPYKEFCAHYSGKNLPLVKKHRQKKFALSNRFFRGQILKKLISEKKIDVSELDADFRFAANQLLAEKLICQDKNTLYLPK